MNSFRLFITATLVLFGTTSVWAQSGPSVTVVRTPRAARSGDKAVATRATPQRPLNPASYASIRYPWKKNITATVFWVGEVPTPNNPTPNNKSSWDQEWQKNYGGRDHPEPSRRRGLLPKGFTPQQNPFYVALPYNDVESYRSHKSEASRVIPWFSRLNPKPGETVLKGRWVQIYANGRSCYAQWEDCGPFTTDDWEYVFGNRPPKNKKNKGAGIDISPAVRDFLKIGNRAKVHWRFVEFAQVERGPWSLYGDNNPFVNKEADDDHQAKIRYMEHLRQMRDRSFRERDLRYAN